ncbi:MAG TPA: hypothetical protein VMZ90_07255 [Vicinamibacterales bacterium]|nr:hypothetical protein [Vicinamibacterales bacterium]
MRMAGKTPLWIAVCLLIAWGFVAASRRSASSLPQGVAGSDLQLYRAITARVAAGENYYHVLADELPARNYATRPVFNWRLPTLTWLNAIPPSPDWGRAILIVLGATLVGSWLIVIRRSVPRVWIAGVIIISLGTVPVVLSGVSVVVYEAWAGVLIAASLGCWGLGRWKTSVALGGTALLIRELALPYAVIMAAVAWWDGRRREALAWVAAIGVFAAFWAGHVSHVIRAMPSEGLVNSWLGFGGWGFVLDASQSSTLFMLLPKGWDNWMLAILIPVLWAGSWYWADALGRRLSWVLGGYFAMFTIVGRPDNWYWGFLVGPLIPLAGLGYFFRPKGSNPRSAISAERR